MTLIWVIFVANITFRDDLPTFIEFVRVENYTTNYITNDRCMKLSLEVSASFLKFKWIPTAFHQGFLFSGIYYSVNLGV